MEVERWARELGAADDPVALVLEGLVRGQGEAVGRVIDVAVKHDWRDLCRLALIDEDLVEVHLVAEKPAGITDQADLSRGQGRHIDLVRTDRGRAARAEVVHLLDERLARVGGVRPTATVEVLRLLRERTVDGVWFDLIPKNQPLAEARRLAVVESHGGVVRRLDLIDEIPDRVARKSADPVRRRDILRGERFPVVPLES